MGRTDKSSFLAKIFLILKLVNFLILLAIATPASSRLYGSQETDFSTRQYLSRSKKVESRRFPNFYNNDYWTPRLNEDVDPWTKPASVCKEGTRLCGRERMNGWEYKCCPVTENLHLQTSNTGLSINNFEETKSGNSGYRCIWTGCMKSGETACSVNTIWTNTRRSRDCGPGEQVNLCCHPTQTPSLRRVQGGVLAKSSEEEISNQIPHNGQLKNNIEDYGNPVEEEKSDQTPQNEQLQNGNKKIENSDERCIWTGCMKSWETACSLNSIWTNKRRSTDCTTDEIQNCCLPIRSSSIRKYSDEKY